MATHVMIDSETLSTTPNACILTIGAVTFDPYGTGVLEKLELRPEVEEQLTVHNRDVSDATVDWWSKQAEEIRNDVMGDHDRVPFKDCMDALYKFCWNKKAVWSHGSVFDVMLMQSAWDQLKMSYPWEYYNIRDTRTLYDIAGVNLKDPKYKTKTTHRAIDDAEHQVIVLQDAYKKLKKAGL